MLKEREIFGTIGGVGVDGEFYARVEISNVLDGDEVFAGFDFQFDALVAGVEFFFDRGGKFRA